MEKNTLNDFVDSLKNIQTYLQGIDGQPLSESENNVLLPGGSYMHTDSENETEEESAKFEQEHPQEFRAMREILQNIEDKLKS